MSFEEKGVWTLGIVAVLTFTGYVIVIAQRAADVPIADIDYVWPMVIAIGAAIVIGVIVTVILAIASPRDAGKKDERDREIYRRGEYMGQSLVVAGAMWALFLAMIEADYFWIANSLYLFFFLSAMVATVAKLVAYRKGFVGW
jgi:uncharacterized integral membrane protein